MWPMEEVPRIEDLAELNDLVISFEESLLGPDLSFVVVVVLSADDGTPVRVSWDAVFGSLRVHWRNGQGNEVELYRERVTRITVNQERGETRFWARTRSEGYFGEMTLTVGPLITVREAMMVG